MKPCMGGWCSLRDKCPRYKPAALYPDERLCLPNQDGVYLVNGREHYIFGQPPADQPMENT